MRSPVRALLATFSLHELRRYPLRNAVAVLAVALGVALAFSVHLINASARDAMAQALRASSGQPDLELFRNSGDITMADLARLLQRPEVELALPVLDINPSPLAVCTRSSTWCCTYSVSTCCRLPDWRPN